jgi:hypothetical protein
MSLSEKNRSVQEHGPRRRLGPRKPAPYDSVLDGRRADDGLDDDGAPGGGPADSKSRDPRKTRAAGNVQGGKPDSARGPLLAPTTPSTKASANGTKQKVPVITQEELREYVELQALGRRLREARDDLKERLQAGAAVEPGELSAFVKAQTHRQLTWAGLTAVVGEEFARHVREQLAPTEYRYLHVKLLVDRT